MKFNSFDVLIIDELRFAEVNSLIFSNKLLDVEFINVLFEFISSNNKLDVKDILDDKLAEVNWFISLNKLFEVFDE